MKIIIRAVFISHFARCVLFVHAAVQKFYLAAHFAHCVHAIKAQWKKNGAFILFTSFSLIILLFYSRGLIKRRTHAFVHVVHAFIVRLQKPAVILWMKVYRVVRVVSFTLFIAAFMLLFVHYKAAWIKERTLDRQKTHEYSYCAPAVRFMKRRVRGVNRVSTVTKNPRVIGDGYEESDDSTCVVYKEVSVHWWYEAWILAR